MNGVVLAAGWVAEAMSATLARGAGDREFAGVSIDSRTIAPGELYFALRGERFDGVDFVPAAVAAGAAGVVAPRGRAGNVAGPAVAVLEVDDTVAALQRLANAVRRASGARVVAITGSAGKTTTKEVTADFLSTRYRVIRNRGNLNNHIGLPLSLIELRTRPDVAVVELGMNHAGEIRTLVRIAEPEVRVWTNVGEAHLGFFDSLDAIADAKAEILEHASGETLLVANADDDRVMARSGSFPGRTLTFGMEHPAAVRAESIVDRGIAGTSATVSTPRGTVELSTPLIGRSNLANVLAAAAVALDMDVPLDVVAARARQLRPAAHRGQVLNLANGVVVIDDSYNANPTAVRQALDVLSAASRPDGAEDDQTDRQEARDSKSRGRHGRRNRRIAVLGEMLELGEQSVLLHEAVGRYAASRADLLFGVGGAAARKLVDAAVAAGMAAGAVRYFETSELAADAVLSLVDAGDVVLVKGSRGVRTDLVVERLRAEHG